MGNVFTVAASEAPEFEEGLYEADFKGSDILDKGAFGPFRRWEFDVYVDGDAERHSGGTSLSMSTGSNGYRFLCGILGRQPEVGEQVDLDELVGRPCRVMLEANKKGWPTVTDVKPKAKKKKAAEADEE